MVRWRAKILGEVQGCVTEIGALKFGEGGLVKELVESVWWRFKDVLHSKSRVGLKKQWIERVAGNATEHRATSIHIEDHEDILGAIYAVLDGFVVLVAEEAPLGVGSMAAGVPERKGSRS
ncbi:hypothetical protein BDR07DRAFT_1478100 [Suillus spraguei]|nr:hypothetical protein BDR07DRAFT_1478100 [Suillus spraguei]